MSFSEITITHFKNPNWFWFKYLSNDDEAHRDRDHLENQIEISVCHALLQATAQATEEFKPSEGDIVAALIRKCGKWIRARIDLIASDGRVKIWAIDYGKPLTVSVKENLMPLPRHLQQICCVEILVGGISSYAPGCLVCNKFSVIYRCIVINICAEFIGIQYNNSARGGCIVFKMAGRLCDDVQMFHQEGNNNDISTENPSAEWPFIRKAHTSFGRCRATHRETSVRHEIYCAFGSLAEV